MRAALHRLDRVLAMACGALLAALTVVVTFQVLGRYVPFIPRPLWTEEIARLLLAWLVFVGAAVALRRSEHFLIDLIPSKLDARLGGVLQLLVLTLLTVVSLVLVVGGIMLAYGGLTRISTASGLHLAWALSAVPVGAFFMLVFSLELVVKVLRNESLPEPETSAVHPVPDGDPSDPDPAPDDKSPPGDSAATAARKGRER